MSPHFKKHWAAAGALPLLGMALSLCALLGRPQVTAVAEPLASVDPLVELNKVFRKAYAQTRSELLAHANPLIIVDGDELVLLHNGKRSIAQVVPEQYRVVKTIAHVPLTVYVMLLRAREQKGLYRNQLSKALLEELAQYRKQLDGIDEKLKGLNLSPQSLKNCTRILADSRQFLDGILTRRRLQPNSLSSVWREDELTSFARSQGPVLLQIVAEAARLEIDRLHRQVTAWKATLTPEEWNHLRVVILGSQMPRKGNRVVQYFARLLREPGEGTRIIYAEGLGDEGRALNLLGTHVVDTTIGNDFFLDRKRMHRDLLSDAAEEYLERLDLEKPIR